MIPFAIFFTLLGGCIGHFCEPDTFAFSIPVAIMGGFILKAIKDNKPKDK